MFKVWFLKTSGTPLTKMGHGIEQAIMRFVRSTSVTLTVLKAMIQMCFGECNCWVQRQCIWELAITKGRSNNGKVTLRYSALKSKKKKKKKKRKQEQHPNELVLNNTVLDSLQRGQTARLRRNTAWMNLTRLREIKQEGPEKWSAGFSLETCQTRIFNSRMANFAMATRTRDNTHKQTTFIIFFSFWKNMWLGY